MGKCRQARKTLALWILRAQYANAHSTIPGASAEVLEYMAELAVKAHDESLEEENETK